jgi:hypothetical protein
MNSKAHAGKDALDGYRGADVKSGEADERLSPPADDNPDAVSQRGKIDNDPSPADDNKTVDVKDDDSAPKGPPADDIRAKIFSRFDQRRAAQAAGETVPLDGEPPPEGEADKEEEDKIAKAPAKSGPSDSEDEDDKPQTLTLKVNGKTIVKSIQEIAVLSDLTPEEVLEKPERAIRYAQIEVAKTHNLEEARRIRRETSSRQNDDADRTARPDLNQDRTKTGTQDVGDQSDPGRKTTGDMDFTKLVEDIQIASPEEAGQKLKDTIAAFVKNETTKTVSETEAGRIAREHTSGIIKSMNEFTAAHPEVKDNPYIASAMTPALYDEYREDLIVAIQAEEGIDEAEARALVSEVGTEQIAQAHKARRMRGDPHVRQVDKAFFEKVYERVADGLGLKADQTKQQQTEKQDFTQTREARKRALPQQPRRASTPLAPSPEQPKPLTRSSVVQDMRRARGQKPHHAR